MYHPSVLRLEDHPIDFLHVSYPATLEDGIHHGYVHYTELQTNLASYVILLVGDLY